MTPPLAEAVPPTHPLDFIVFGTARSGCAAAAQAVNLDPGLFCGTEHFFGSAELDYAALEMPGAFFADAHRASTPGHTGESRRLLREKLDQGVLSAYGNTLQGYHLQIDRLHAALPRLRALCVYRCPRDVADSYDRRAANPVDPWPEGRIGLFGLADWMILLACLAEARATVAVVDFDALFATDAGMAERVLQYLGGRVPAAEVLERFRREAFAGGPQGAAARPWQAMRYDTFLGEIGAPDLDRTVAEAAMFGAPTMRETLRDFVAAGFERTIAFVGDTVIKAGRPAEIGWARRWAFVTLSGFDNLANPAYDLVRPALGTLVARLAACDVAEGREDVERLLRMLRRRGEAADLAGEQLAQSNALAAAGQISAAVAAARAAVALAPEQVRLQVVLGQMLLRAGRSAEAIDVLARAIARGFDGVGAHLAHSRALFREGQPEAARAAAERAVAAAPANEAARDWWATFAPPSAAG